MVSLADAFARQGHDVALVLLCRGRVGGPLPRERVSVVELRAPSVPFAAVPFARWLRSRRPDAVLATLVAPNLLAVAASRLLPREERPRVVVREANTLSAALRFRPPAFRAASRAAVRAAYPAADGIVAVSAGAADDLASFLGVPRARVVAISNPATTPESAAREAEPLHHPWLDGEPGARSVPVVVAAGRLVEKKGFDVLLDAFARVRRARAARLVLLGDGPERAALAARVSALGVSADVLLAGFVANPHAWFARSELFVLSSFAEGMPNAMLQAMSAGCAVVATDCPSGPREILADVEQAHGRWGTLVPMGDPAALGDAILRALANLPARSLARERAASFDIAPIAQAYERVLFGALVSSDGT